MINFEEKIEMFLDLLKKHKQLLQVDINQCNRYSLDSTVDYKDFSSQGVQNFRDLQANMKKAEYLQSQMHLIDNIEAHFNNIFKEDKEIK